MAQIHVLRATPDSIIEGCEPRYAGLFQMIDIAIELLYDNDKGEIQVEFLTCDPNLEKVLKRAKNTLDELNITLKGNNALVFQGC